MSRSTGKGTLITTTIHIEVVKSHILDDFFLLVDITFGNWDIFLSFEIVLCRVGVRSAYSFNGTACGFDVDDIADSDLLLLNVLIYAWIKLKLLLPFSGFESNNNAVDDLAIASVRVFIFLWSDLGNLTFPDLFSLLNSQTNGSSKVFHQNFSLLDLSGVHLRADHWTERNFRAKL